MLEIKNIVTETKNALDGLISKLDEQTQERTSDLEHMSMETSQTNTKRNKNENKHNINELSKNCGTILKGLTGGYLNTILYYSKEKKERSGRMSSSNNGQNFSKISDRHHTAE